jgi:predicted TIM-barrel fold metal-dependent hydrolase
LPSGEDRMGVSYMVIDFHAHCFPDFLAGKAISELEYGCGVKAVHDGTAEGLKRYMDRCGVNKSVVLSIATKPSQVGAINEWSKKSNEEKLCFFGTIHPDDENVFKVIGQLRSEGFCGVKLHPDYQNFFADEQRMMPVYEALRDEGLLAVFHAGMDIGFPVPIHCTPLMLKNIYDSVKGLKMVAAHMGSHALWRDAEELLCGLPIFFDTSYSYYMLGKEGMERMIKKHGAEMVLFGTDSPWTKADEEMERIASLDLPESDIDKILCKNALSLLS